MNLSARLFHLFIVCFCIFCGGIVAASSAEATNDAHTPEAAPTSVFPHPFKRLPTADLCRIIAEGPSLLSKEFRVQMAEALRQLDKIDLKALRKTEVSFESLSDPWDLIHRKTYHLPKHTLMSERAIMYMLLLQVKMLERELLADASGSEAVRNFSICMHRRKPTEQLFYDTRDAYVSSILFALEDIATLQRALGSSGMIDLHFPTDLKDMHELQLYILKRISLLTERGKQLAR